ncbi:TetR/AcrR family transcriptional regulator [Streptomyces sp. NBC_01803]|uniref:TetR/AcrR family transcriptional regulator n=1 Tax=Streptomyces sp. NBC_01803 TaxID=2975946 RepID=UPI002DDA4F2D|nr:TetR/AcrR family transcriptional regulator [Streptomyces sp. NBC_01803]WSA42984.1 TetR/AcrR family transcriptional regulator [Streptomyces sp. NBC_01803]
MAGPKQSRRERLRAETAAEIKTIALAHMVEGGAAALSLRAIAREMGMTAGAIYSYFDTRDDLITALIVDVYTSLADRLEAAHAGMRDGDPADGIVAHGLAYRDWAIANREKFQLVYGAPLPEYHQPENGPAAAAGHRVCRMLADLIGAAAPAGHEEAGGPYDWSDFDPRLVESLGESHLGLTPDLLALTVRTWGRMHGLVTLEVYGHLRDLSRDPAMLFRSEMLDLVRSLGLAGTTGGPDRAVPVTA